MYRNFRTFLWLNKKHVTCGIARQIEISQITCNSPKWQMNITSVESRECEILIKIRNNGTYKDKFICSRQLWHSVAKKRLTDGDISEWEIKIIKRKNILTWKKNKLSKQKKFKRNSHISNNSDYSDYSSHNVHWKNIISDIRDLRKA